MNRRHWRRCWVKTSHGQVRCTECLELLATHTDAQVRLMLAKEAWVPEEFLEHLLTDADVVVALAAEGTARADYPGLVERESCPGTPPAAREITSSDREDLW